VQKYWFFFFCIISSVLCGYDPDFAHKALLRSYASYCLSGDIKLWSCYWCSADIKPGGPVITVNVSNDNTFAYVFKEDNVVWVVIRGTVIDSIINWINNVDFELTPLWTDDGTIQVHKGFKDDSSALYPGILAAVQSQLKGCSGCSILLTGHSLGGAIASILSEELSKDLTGIPIAEWTFGSPRTGNPAFANYHIGVVPQSWRIVNQHDIVPHLPTKLLDIFKHVPTEVWYTNNSTYRVCDGSGEDPSCSDSYHAIGSVDDHLTYFGIDLRNGKPYGCM